MQGTLERALSTIMEEDIQVAASGRTDAGAHAVRQVVAFTTSSALPGDAMCRAANAVLPRNIAVTEAHDAVSSFHPRVDAHSRTYRYLIWNRATRSPFWEERATHVKRPLNESMMNEAAQCLLGIHDFSAFVPNALEGQRVRRIDGAVCRRDGDLVMVELRGSGFMRQMVRSIVGTLVRVGLGKMSSTAFAAVLQSGERKAAGDTLPACGLYLVDVQYDTLAEPHAITDRGLHPSRLYSREGYS